MNLTPNFAATTTLLSCAVYDTDCSLFITTISFSAHEALNFVKSISYALMVADIFNNLEGGGKRGAYIRLQANGGLPRTTHNGMHFSTSSSIRWEVEMATEFLNAVRVRPCFFLYHRGPSVRFHIFLGGGEYVCPSYGRL